jgi:catechol 2,3-dioxygenase-like lactoylglutathione lyase family enzyme
VIHHVFHFSFTVSDLDASIDWYTRVLGLELVHRQVQDNAYTRTLVGIPDAVLEIAQFKIPGVSPGLSTHMLELVEYKRPKGERPPLLTYNVGDAHLALLVTNIHTEYERLRQQEVVFRNPPVAITEGANRGGYSCYFQDPDGITLEMLQPSPERQRAMGISQD